MSHVAISVSTPFLTTLTSSETLSQVLKTLPRETEKSPKSAAPKNAGQQLRENESSHIIEPLESAESVVADLSGLVETMIPSLLNGDDRSKIASQSEALRQGIKDPGNTQLEDESSPLLVTDDMNVTGTASNASVPKSSRPNPTVGNTITLSTVHELDNSSLVTTAIPYSLPLPTTIASAILDTSAASNRVTPSSAALGLSHVTPDSLNNSTDYAARTLATDHDTASGSSKFQSALQSSAIANVEPTPTGFSSMASFSVSSLPSYFSTGRMTSQVIADPVQSQLIVSFHPRNLTAGSLAASSAARSILTPVPTSASSTPREILSLSAYKSSNDTDSLANTSATILINVPDASVKNAMSTSNLATEIVSNVTILSATPFTQGNAQPVFTVVTTTTDGAPRSIQVLKESAPEPSSSMSASNSLSTSGGLSTSTIPSIFISLSTSIVVINFTSLSTSIIQNTSTDLTARTSLSTSLSRFTPISFSTFTSSSMPTTSTAFMSTSNSVAPTIPASLSNIIDQFTSTTTITKSNPSLSQFGSVDSNSANLDAVSGSLLHSPAASATFAISTTSSLLAAITYTSSASSLRSKTQSTTPDSSNISTTKSPLSSNFDLISGTTSDQVMLSSSQTTSSTQTMLMSSPTNLTGSPFSTLQVSMVSTRIGLSSDTPVPAPGTSRISQSTSSSNSELYTTGVRLSNPTPIISKPTDPDQFDDYAQSISPGLVIQLYEQRAINFTVSTNGVCRDSSCVSCAQ